MSELIYLIKHKKFKTLFFCDNSLTLSTKKITEKAVFQSPHKYPNQLSSLTTIKLDEISSISIKDNNVKLSAFIKIDNKNLKLNCAFEHKNGTKAFKKQLEEFCFQEKVNKENAIGSILWHYGTFITFLGGLILFLVVNPEFDLSDTQGKNALFGKLINGIIEYLGKNGSIITAILIIAIGLYIMWKKYKNPTYLSFYKGPITNYPVSISKDFEFNQPFKEKLDNWKQLRKKNKLNPYELDEAFRYLKKIKIFDPKNLNDFEENEEYLYPQSNIIENLLGYSKSSHYYESELDHLVHPYDFNEHFKKNIEPILLTNDIKGISLRTNTKEIFSEEYEYNFSFRLDKLNTNKVTDTSGDFYQDFFVALNKLLEFKEINFRFYNIGGAYLILLRQDIANDIGIRYQIRLRLIK